MARMVATKAALSIRIDALSDADSRSEASAAEVGVTNRVKLESRLRALEHRAGIQSVRRVTTGTARPTPRWEMQPTAGGYNAANDSVPLNGASASGEGMASVREMLPTQPAEAVQQAVQAVIDVKKEKKEKKVKKEKRKSEGAAQDIGDVTMDGDEVAGETKEERKARKEAKKAVSPQYSIFPGSNHPSPLSSSLPALFSFPPLPDCRPFSPPHHPTLRAQPWKELEADTYRQKQQRRLSRHKRTERNRPRSQARRDQQKGKMERGRRRRRGSR